jgi:hypothetical protein
MKKKGSIIAYKNENYGRGTSMAVGSVPITLKESDVE